MDARLIGEFRQIVGDAGLVSGAEQLRTYECDGLTLFRVVPELVLLPSSTLEVQQIVKLCHRERIPFVARGSGTGLSGGALPVKGGVVISVSRMNRILEIDIPNARLVAEPGVTNAAITEAVSPWGYFYAPDPSSQSVCTVAGNVAENSGGAHCFKYGVTTTYILALEVVLSDGSLVRLGGRHLEEPGYDLVGAFVGSEGTFGIVTQVTLRVIKKPETTQTLMAAFNSSREAGDAVSGIVSSGMFPAALEIMDRLAIEASEAAVHANYPHCQALLLVELDGSGREVELLMEKLGPLCRSCGAWEIRLAKSEAERIAVWKGRKAAFAAVGHISPAYLVQDGVIPRTALPRVLEEIDRLKTRAGLRVANVFHAGDGNLHPLVLYDHRIPGQAQRAMALAEDILRLCVEAGGSITGEHGIGEEKKHFMPVMFSAADLDAMQRLRSAFDPFGLCNPTKIFPGAEVSVAGPSVSA
jgi:glycolate oxidase